MNKKRIFTAVLAGIMTLSSFTALSSCNKQKNEPVKTKRTNVYRGTEIKLPEDIGYVNNLMVGNDTVYMTYSKEVERKYDPNSETNPKVEPMETEEETLAGTDDAVTDGTTDNASGDTSPEDDTESEETEATDSLSASNFARLASSVAVADVALDVPALDVPADEGVYYEYITCLYYTKLDGSDSGEIELSSNTNGYIRNILIDSNDKPWIVEQEYWYNEDYSESRTYYRMFQLDIESGEKLNPIDLNEAIEASGLVEENVEYYLNSIAIDGNDNIHVALESGIVTLDMTGKKLSNSQPLTESGWISGMMISGNEVYLGFYKDNGGQILMHYDPATGALDKIESENLKKLMDRGYGNDGSFPEGKIYVRDSTGISQYDIATDTVSELMNYINCDIDSSSMNNSCYTKDGRIISSYTDWSGDTRKTYCTIYDRVPDEEMSEEIIVNLACTYTNYQLRRTVIRFNKRNTGVRIAIKDYNQYNNEENEWTGAVTQLNTDMITGKVPDILVIDNSLPAETYFKKNMFIDLNKYIDGENGIDRSTMLDNILRSCEKEGKLNSVITAFNLYTLAAKSSYVGNEPGWTLEEMMTAIKNMPEGMSAFMEYSRDEVISNLFSYSMDSFINWTTGETYFETDGFIELIDFLKTVPEKGYWEAYWQQMEESGGGYDEKLEMEMQGNFDMRFYKDTALFGMQYIGDFRSYNEIIRNFATDDVTMIGYPTRDENSNGATIVPQMELAICTASRCPDDAWSFIKYLLTDEEYLDSLYAFTLNKQKLEEKFKTENDDSEYGYMMTEDDMKWYEERYSPEYVEYLKKTQRKYSESDGEKIMELLKGVTRVSRTDNSVLDIVKEELSSFFGGTKSAADTARVINSRVKVYVSQNS